MNVEVGQAAREDTARAMRAILGSLGSEARTTLDDAFVDGIWLDTLERHGPDGALREILVCWAAADPAPLVLLIDEIDALVGDTLISVLRQLRSGYDRRPRGFPHSVILCGVRDVRDYRVQSASEGFVLGGSAFNIHSESLRLGDFSGSQARALLEQHTAETGQSFDEDAVRQIRQLTGGQPWLVNALASGACFEDPRGRDRSRPIGADLVQDARESLILARRTHLDQLVHKLREDRVRRVVGPLLSGGMIPGSVRGDDLQYCRCLGLIRRELPLRIANPIYRELMARADVLA